MIRTIVNTFFFLLYNGESVEIQDHKGALQIASKLVILLGKLIFAFLSMRQDYSEFTFLQPSGLEIYNESGFLYVYNGQKLEVFEIRWARVAVISTCDAIVEVFISMFMFLLWFFGCKEPAQVKSGCLLEFQLQCSGLRN